MGALNYKPVLSDNGQTGAGTSLVNDDHTVPAGKRWLVDYIETEFGVQAAGNKVDIQHPVGTNIWPQEPDFLKRGFDLGVRFPRAIELEENDVLRIVFTRGTSSTVQAWVYIMERDL